ncbi:MAG: ATP-binding cassette domain-containing protein [Candidatus Eisenbacteria bacterium]|nr:ATP-binding cassette domain-containing protein [Candidatus Eisenbacteria bacterium]
MHDADQAERLADRCRPQSGIDHGPHRDAIIDIQGMSYRYPDGTLALDRIHLSVARASTLAVIGPNGGGKTTLLKILLGLLDGYRGTVRIAGLTPCEARRRGDVATWVPQRANFHWDFPVRLREVVAMGLLGRNGLFRSVGKDQQAFLERVLDVLEIRKIADRPIGDLSGGQQQRALIARALVPRPRVLLLDEPGAGLDASGIERLQSVLSDVKREFGITLVSVSHDLRRVVADAQRVACLNQRLHFHDVPESLTRGVLDRLYSCSLDGILPAACHHDDPQEA